MLNIIIRQGTFAVTKYYRKKRYEMTKIIPTEKITAEHWQLYLMADPEKAAVMKYIQRTKKFEIDTPNGEPIASLMLLKTRPGTVEIINLAVDPAHRRHGLASQLIDFAEQYAHEFHCRRLVVGTASTSFGPLALYQRNGFRVVGVDRDFFTANYTKPIVENGITVRDMLRLVKTMD